MDVLLLLLLSSCILLAHVDLSSASDVCLESIDMKSGIIVYSDANNDAQDIANLVDIETLIVLLKITVPSSENGTNESRWYQVSDTGLCYYLSPELLDLMTFNALKLTERIQKISLDVRTFSTCANKPWEKVLHDAFSLNEYGFARLLQTKKQTIYKVIVGSGVLVFMSLAFTSFIIVYVFVVPVQGAITASQNLNQMLPIVNALSPVVYWCYLSYTTYHTTFFYLNLASTSEPFIEDYILSFTVNAIVLPFYTVSWAILSALIYFQGTLWDRISTGCSTALMAAAVYHVTFLLLALVEDFATALSSILIQTTALVFLYTLIPTALRFYWINSTRKVCSLPLIPVVYLLLYFSGKDVLYTGQYVATGFWLAVVLFMTSLTWTFCFFELVSAFKQRDIPPRRPSESRADEGWMEVKQDLTVTEIKA